MTDHINIGDSLAMSGSYLCQTVFLFDGLCLAIALDPSLYPSTSQSGDEGGMIRMFSRVLLDSLMLRFIVHVGTS